MRRLLNGITVCIVGCCVGIGAGVSCNHQVAPECYEELEYVEPEPGTLAPDYPYCRWTLGTLPAPEDGYGLTHPVTVRFVPTDDEPCDACDVERLDGLLRAAIKGRMSQGAPSCARMDPSDPVRACVYPAGEASNECVVSGLFYSNYHDVPETAGCGDCRENGSCPATQPP